jgi:hypothetical protein
MPTQQELEQAIPLGMPVVTQRTASPPPEDDIIGYEGEDATNRYFMPVLGRCIKKALGGRWAAVISHPETGPERWGETVNRIAQMRPVRAVLRTVFDAYASRTDARIAALEARLEAMESKLSFLDEDSPL